MADLVRVRGRGHPSQRGGGCPSQRAWLNQMALIGQRRVQRPLQPATLCVVREERGVVVCGGGADNI